MNDHVYGRRGSVAAVWCALGGVAFATVLTAPMGMLFDLVQDYAPNIVTALVILFVSAWTLGDLAGRAVSLGGWSGFWTGWSLALTCLTLTVFAGSMVTICAEAWTGTAAWDNAIIDDLYPLLFWVMVVGFLPTLWLGWLFADLLKRDRR